MIRESKIRIPDSVKGISVEPSEISKTEVYHLSGGRIIRIEHLMEANGIYLGLKGRRGSRNLAGVLRKPRSQIRMAQIR